MFRRCKNRFRSVFTGNKVKGDLRSKGILWWIGPEVTVVKTVVKLVLVNLLEFLQGFKGNLGVEDDSYGLRLETGDGSGFGEGYNSP